MDPKQRQKVSHQSLPPNFAIVRKPRAPKHLVNILRKTIAKDKLPKQWDSRSHWKDPISGNSVIMTALNQKQCGSCYVFSSTECLRNRLAIAGLNASLPNPSQQVAMDCSINGDTLLGCSAGGEPEAMLDWLSQNRVPSDQPPYQYRAADASCKGDNPDDGSGMTGAGVYTVSDSSPVTADVVDDIKRDIMVNGPVVASYLVYMDFLDYWNEGGSSEVYSYDGKSELDGGHAVLIIGWGISNKQPYWLVMNSWGETGPSKDGTFKIAIATSGTGIDSNVNGIYVSNAVELYAANEWAWQSVDAPPGIPSTTFDNSTQLYLLLVTIAILGVIVILLLLRSRR